MSVSTEVQRTLVKSPPELWSELSNPEALARHLAELGEIRITGVEPETKVEWEAEGASGVVHLKQSGWGTKVTLSVTRKAQVPQETSEPEAVTTPELEPEVVTEQEPAAADPEPTNQEPEPIAPEPDAVAAEHELTAPGPEPTALPIAPEPDACASPEPEASAEPATEPTAEPEPRTGFFARLFGRRKARRRKLVEAQPGPESVHESQTVPEPVSEPELEPEVVALAVPEPIYPDRPVEPTVDLAGELRSVEAQMTEETTELLTGVLDRLGAAHHRPFSRG
jgi:hypothetical protein